MVFAHRYITFGLFCATVCALRESSIPISPNARWSQNAKTIGGGNGQGSGTNQLSRPSGLYVDEDWTVYVADTNNHRVMAYKSGSTTGQIVAGGNGAGVGTNQLNMPFDVIFDKRTDSIIICDMANRRVVRWPRQNATSGETMISNIDCRGLTMDIEGFLYVIDSNMPAVRRFSRGDSIGTIVAGGHGVGHDANQMFEPQHIFVDRDQAVYVSEYGQQRVTKWAKGENQRVIVAGGYGKGNSLSHMVYISGIVVDQLGTVYISDMGNGRIMRWPKGATQGTIAVGTDGTGQVLNQLNMPLGLAFDRQGNLYVADSSNHRIQKFDLEFNA